MDAINPQDVESVSVLKDASSTAVYGARGAFGVVLVRRDSFSFEVATFRRDGSYRDGRRPEAVCFTDAEEDAVDQGS